MSRLPFATCAVLCLATLTACNKNDRPPTLEEYTGSSYFTKSAVMSTLSSDASYRSAYILLSDGAHRDYDDKGGRFSGQFCPEPPPDVAQSVSSAISAALDANVEAPGALLGPQSITGTAKAGLGGQYGAAVASAVAPLIKRSQGLQFYRDQAFYTCVAFLNGVLGPDEYEQKLKDSADLAAAVLMLEIVKGGTAPDANDFQKIEADLAKAVATLKPLHELLGQMLPAASKNEGG